MAERYFSNKALFVEPGIKTGMPVQYDNPQEVGADRIVNSVAAFDKYGGPCIVVDFGTAINFDAVSARGEYLGGVLAPASAFPRTRFSPAPRASFASKSKTPAKSSAPTPPPPCNPASFTATPTWWTASSSA